MKIQQKIETLVEEFNQLVDTINNAQQRQIEIKGAVEALNELLQSEASPEAEADSE